MRVPVILFLLSLAAVAVVLAVPGWSDLIVIAAASAVASLIVLVWKLLFLPVRGQAPEATGPRPTRPARRKAEPQWIVVDGSNVMYWRDGTPQIDTVRAVIGRLRDLGYTPGVVFDANAGHLLEGRYRHDHAFGRMLGLPEERVMVVPKGSPADPVILTAARDLGARIVTNDRYRDWAADHPEVATPGQLVRGEYRDGALWLDLAPARDPRRPAAAS